MKSLYMVLTIGDTFSQAGDEMIFIGHVTNEIEDCNPDRSLLDHYVPPTDYILCTTVDSLNAYFNFESKYIKTTLIRNPTFRTDIIDSFYNYKPGVYKLDKTILELVMEDKVKEWAKYKWAIKNIKMSDTISLQRSGYDI